MSEAEKLSKAKSAKKSVPRARVGRKPKWQCAARTFRKHFKFTLADVARGTGLNGHTIKTIEQGYDPTLSRASKLARFFGTTIENLWTPLEDEAGEQ